MDAPSHQNDNQQKKGKGKGKGQGQGRSKVKLEKMENDANLQVTFSKRRAGLFKKASELDTLCGCNTLVIAFSPSQKAFSYGNPDVETVANMFLNAGGGNHRIEGFNDDGNHRIEGFNDDPMANQFSLEEITDMETQVDITKKEIKELKKMRKKNEGQNGGAANLDELDYQQLDWLMKSIREFKKNIYPDVQNPMDQSWIEGGIVFPSGSSSYVGDHYDSNHYPAISNNDSLAPSSDNYPAGSFFSEMTTTDTGYVDPFVPAMNDNMGLLFQNLHVEDGLNPVDAQMNTNTNAGADNPFFPWGYAEDNTQGFPSNYGYAEDNTQGFPSNYGYTEDNTQGFPSNYGYAEDNTQGFPNNYGYAEDNTKGFPGNYGGAGFM